MKHKAAGHQAGTRDGEPIAGFASVEEWVKARIRTIPDFPKPGIQFRDITTLLADTRGFRKAVDELVQPYVGVAIDKIAGIEARGFILGGAVAHQLGCGFVPVRKAGKLPHRVIARSYQLEYGEDRLEIHEDAIANDDHVLLVDDLIATGGTAMAALDLIEAAGGRVLGACFVIDLPDLGGAERLRQRGVEVLSLCRFAGE
ncbi:MAG: adenine phosphoribosyltransferase [Alphaproteobacteria bacterium]|nr:MAG: adenine phosphoribosyltransferase [Alphaproteobacteria bacterium]